MPLAEGALWLSLRTWRFAIMPWIRVPSSAVGCSWCAAISEAPALPAAAPARPPSTPASARHHSGLMSTNLKYVMKRVLKQLSTIKPSRCPQCPGRTQPLARRQCFCRWPLQAQGTTTEPSDSLESSSVSCCSVEAGSERRTLAAAVFLALVAALAMGRR